MNKAFQNIFLSKIKPGRDNAFLIIFLTLPLGFSGLSMGEGKDMTKSAKPKKQSI